ncbi:hypothetical protein DFH28DRAFT_1166217, partial [Melampsora americana]
MLFKFLLTFSSCVGDNVNLTILQLSPLNLYFQNDLNSFSTRNIQVNQQNGFSLVCDRLQIVQQKTDSCRQELVEGHSDLKSSIAKLDQLRQDYTTLLQPVSANCLSSPCGGNQNDLVRFKSSLASCLQSLNSVVSYMSNQFSGSFEVSCKPIFSNLWATLQPVFASAQSFGTDMKSFLSGMNLNYDALSKLDFGISSYLQHSSSAGLSMVQGVSPGSGSVAGPGQASGAGSSYDYGASGGANAGLQGGAGSRSGQGLSVGSGHGAGEVSGQAAISGPVPVSGPVNGGGGISNSVDANSKGSVGISSGQGAGVSSGQGAGVSYGQNAGVSSGQAVGATSGYGSGVASAGGSGSVSSYGAVGQGAGVSYGQNAGVSSGQAVGATSGYGSGVGAGVGAGAGAGARSGYIGGDTGFELEDEAEFAANTDIGSEGIITLSQY